jgi:cytochrome b561
VRFVHWTSAALVLSLLGVGLAMVDSFATWRLAALMLHKTGGVLVLLLTAMRLVLQVRQGALPVPPAVPAGQHKAAILTHRLIYTLLVLVPLSGWAMQGAAGMPLRVCGVRSLPALTSEGLVAYSVLRTVHGVLTSVLLVAVLSRIAGALHDGFVGHHGFLRRMLWGTVTGSIAPPGGIACAEGRPRRRAGESRDLARAVAIPHCSVQ